MMRRISTLLLVSWATIALAQGVKPRVPPGLDPGGFTVGLMTAGIDYTRPEVARHLARDGEGELIGRDLVDDDNRPFATTIAGSVPREEDGTELVLRVAAAAPVRIVPMRIATTRPATLAKAVAFAARTPARIVLISMQTEQPEYWQALVQAVKEVPHVVVVSLRASADGIRRDTRQQTSHAPDNLVVVGAADDAGAEVRVALPDDGTKTVGRLAAGFLAGLGACAATAPPPNEDRTKLTRLIALYRREAKAPKAAGQIPPQPCTLQMPRP